MSKEQQQRVPVWDPLLRFLHWALVLGVLAAWLTREGYGRSHEWIGYGVLLVVVLRVLWGFLGSDQARFRHFVKGPRSTWRYALQSLRGRAPRQLGHNPLGAWSTLLLLTLVFAVCAVGWLYTTDRYWGIEWVERLHAGLTDVLLAFIAVHLLGVLWACIKQRENLVAAMVHGRKRQLSKTDQQ